MPAKIGCYTDNTGDAATNLRLSQQRADNVKQQLIAMGIAADRLESEGHGTSIRSRTMQPSKAAQQNRRISLHVTQK